MGFNLGPLPESFAEAAWGRIAIEIEAAPGIKAALQTEALRLHGKSAMAPDFIRGMGAILHKQTWSWERGQALLAEKLGEEPSAEELLEAIYAWHTFATHKLYRRGEIRVLLAANEGHVVRVSVDSEGGGAPCGAVDGEVLEPTSDALRKMPPCSHPFCACSWTLIYTNARAE
ncbi:MAG: hypothetical protein ACLGID_18340 [Gammaproteobacteria bacterium]